MKHLLKKLLCMVLVVMLFVSTIPTQVYAAEAREERLPEIAIGEDILGYDVFYLASASASIEENSRTVYLLRVARGGPADSESTALVKIADMTAKYGEDYIVRVRDERTKVENPEGNFSLMEMIEGSDFEQQPITDDEEASRLLQTDPEAQEAYAEGVNTALEFLEEASGLKDKYGDEDPYAAALEGDKAYTDDDDALYAGALPANGNGEVITVGGKDADVKTGDEPLDFDPVQQAANLFTGQNATAQRLISEGDMFQDLQAIANVLTDVVVGASVELTFAEGETEKYLEIVPKDNKVGDGNRMFYIILGAPSGKTTNSAASTCAFTIIDDEEAEPAVVSFSDVSYTHEPGAESVTVTVLRSGAMNSVVSTKIKTTGEGTAQAGRDYSEADAELVFPFGIDHLTLTIPVRTEYLAGTGWFGLALEPVAGCEAGENATATVTIQGTYTDKAGLLAAENAKLMSADGNALLMAAAPSSYTAQNSLSTLKTLSAIDLKNPAKHGVQSLTENAWPTFKGTDLYKEGEGYYETQWKSEGFWGADSGVVGVVYALTWNYWESFFLAGAQVEWDRSYGGGANHAYMKTALIGAMSPRRPSHTDFNFREDALGRNFSLQYADIYPYYSNRDFTNETRYVFPTVNAVAQDKDPMRKVIGYTEYKGVEYPEHKSFWQYAVNGDRPQFLEILNIGQSKDDNVLKIKSVTPILRPFEVTVRDAQPLSYLKADGKRGTFVDTSTEASLVEGGAHAVFFKDDTFTVKTVAGTNVRQYAYMAGLDLLSGDAEESRVLTTFATNDDPSKNTLAWTLNTDNMQKLIEAICPVCHRQTDLRIYDNWKWLVKENKAFIGEVVERQPYIDGYPTYVDFTVRPKLDYINAKVTLRNPYEFPVTFTIDGKDYEVKAKTSTEIKAPDRENFHKGDTLCISAVTPQGIGAGAYVAAGVKYWGKYQSTSPSVDKEGTWDFLYQKPIYVGEEDERLTFADVIIEPNLQADGNTIRVRVKTEELSHFDTQIVRDDDGNITHFPGVLATRGTVDGEYTYFTFANQNGTFNGRTYAVTATPLLPDEVCVWTDRVAQKTYEGNTFYFTAGDTPERNVITLSVDTVRGEVTLKGTLRYANYNLRTGDSGSESLLPAVGAVLAAGSAGGIADQNGNVVTGNKVGVSGRPDHWLRYMVSVNGADILQETPLPELVEAKEEAPEDTGPIVWDFNSDMAMDAYISLGTNLTRTGMQDAEGNDFYRFTAARYSSTDRIKVNLPVEDGSQVLWVKMRIRGNYFTNYIANPWGKIFCMDDSFETMPLRKTNEWQEVVFSLDASDKYFQPGAPIEFFSLWLGAAARESYDIDYVAFFPDEVSARSYEGPAKAPLEGGASLIWDFNSDNAMNANMGAGWSATNVSWQGEKSGSDDYYTFTASGNDPHVSIDTPAAHASNVRWVKIRAKNLSGAKILELFASCGSAGKGIGPTHFAIPIATDGEWHEYVVEITNDEWKDDIRWFRLDPLQGCDNGDSIQIDYIAFFRSQGLARSFRNEDAVPPEQVIIDISSNFPDGISPVTSGIFRDIRITGQIKTTTGGATDVYAIQNGASIPVALGDNVELTVKIAPSQYDFTMTGEDGRIIVNKGQNEVPRTIQLALYDQDGRFKGLYEEVKCIGRDEDDDSYIFQTAIEFMAAEEGEEGEPEPEVSLIPEPGDRLYLRLTTNRLRQTKAIRSADDKDIDNYQYADVYTGMDFYQPLKYEVHKMGIKEPIIIEYGDLPLIGTTGMNLNLPFVNVGVIRIHQGYRIYIGISPFQITDAVKKTHITSMSGAGGNYWSELFSIGDPFGSFGKGIKTAAGMISDFRKDAQFDAQEGTHDATYGMGSPSWKFDLAVGMYFDFHYVTVTQNDGRSTNSYFLFDGLGGYLNVTLGFQMVWYFVLPVVFMPAYIGIEVGGNVLGFLGADFNTEEKITYDDAWNGSVDINKGITSINGGIRAIGYFQLSFGVGLCGTLGLRIAGRVDAIANWEPTDPNGSWGFYVQVKAGLIIDLFLFSVPLMYAFGPWSFGSFERYATPESHTYTPSDDPGELMSAQSTGTFQLREGTGDSTWVGNQAMLMGAFAPNQVKQKTLATNAYERPDSQLITLSDNETVVLAFVDSESAKGADQRTTLKMATYANGVWSDAVTVSDDGTADFQPSIAETKDGKILVAWVSPADASAVDLDTDDGVMAYLNSMEVYAAFVELDDNKQIKTKDGAYGICADTEVTRISNDHYVKDGNTYTFYDANPTVVCDMESGDAMIYFIKSGRYTLGDGGITDYINPYTNDCVVCYMPYNAAADEDVGGRTVPAGWLFNNFYYSELGGVEASEKYIIDNFSGQRFLDGPVNGDNERYAIPDFTAVGYNGLAVYAYTVDTDGNNSTDADKELMLQVYDFRNHETKFRIQLTDDGVADALPQLFRTRVNTAATGGESTDAENTHTKLFWFRGGKQAVYIDVTDLLQNGINNNGTLKTESNGGTAGVEYTYEVTYTEPVTDADGTPIWSNGEPKTVEKTVTKYKYTEPRGVWFANSGDSNAALSQSDFRAVEDAEGNLYLLWTEGVTDENGNAAREIYGTGLIGYAIDRYDEEGNVLGTDWINSGWSKPYRITRDGYTNDELAVAMSGADLMVVHNRFRQELYVPDETREYTEDKPVDFMPITITEKRLIAEVLEPCGSMETERIALYRTETVDGKTSINLTTRPVGGETVTVQVEAANNGMNVARGYKLSLYAGSTLVREIETTEALAPGSSRSHSFEYTLPANVNGLVFKAVAQEMRDAETKQYYADTHTFTADPLVAEASYMIENVETYQTTDGFHAKFKVTNTGNAASGATDTLAITLCGPANIADQFTKAQIKLYSTRVSLAIGASKEYDVPVSILPAMMENYKFVTASVAVEKTYAERSAEGTEYLGTPEYADFDLTGPMNMAVENVTVGVGQSKAINCTMDLGDAFNGSDDVTYALDDLSVARIDNGKVLGVSNGTTTLNVTHAATGATVSAKVTVTGESAPAATEITVEVTGDEGSVSVTAAVEGNTATVTAPTAEQLAEITDRAGETGKVVTDLSSLPDTVTAVSIPAETVKAINEAMEEGAEGLTIKLPNSTVTFDAKALAAIAAQTDGKDLKLCVEPESVSDLNAKQQEAISDLDVQAVYNVYMISGGKRISDFGGGTAAVEVSYPVPKGKNPGGFAVWYVADTGEKTEVPTAATRKAVKWTVTHFSSYVLAYDATRISACARDESCPMSAFTDLDLNAWYHDGIHWALDYSVMNGVGGGLFDPNGDTSRAMIVTMLYRMEGEPKSDYAMTFADVAEGQWYTEAVRWAAENGIVTGYDADSFGPSDKLTREQLATILCRYARYKDVETALGETTPLTGFNDTPEVSDWAIKSVRWAVSAGIINGVGDGTLSPKTSATRAQVATMLMRYDGLGQ